ncbi:MAG: HAMP domain-containing sensor histidine kinase, partial [Pseudomonadota bacterium]
ERVIQPGSGAGEVAEAERAIAAMQTEVLRALSERRRLAALGEAVAKINHDLRNMLAAGQLMTERLGHSEDPIVARVLPKLVASLDRAASLCNHTLAFGKAEERPPEPRAVAVEALLIDVVEGLGLMSEAPPSIATLPASHSGLGLGEVADAPVAEADDVPRSPRVLADGPVRIVSLLGPRLQVSADPDHLFRIFSNLLRNAAEAIRATGRPGCIEIGLAEGQAGDGLLCLLVRDDGPGLPNKALENLFRPFIGGARRGGTGLGLAIAADLARLQNGRLELISTATTGTVFGLTLPTAPTQSTVGALPLGTDVRRAAGQN